MLSTIKTNSLQCVSHSCCFGEQRKRRAPEKNGGPVAAQGRRFSKCATVDEPSDRCWRIPSVKNNIYNMSLQCSCALWLWNALFRLKYPLNYLNSLPLISQSKSVIIFHVSCSCKGSCNLQIRKAELILGFTFIYLFMFLAKCCHVFLTGRLLDLHLSTLTLLEQFSSIMTLHKPWIMLLDGRGAQCASEGEREQNLNGA